MLWSAMFSLYWYTFFNNKCYILHHVYYTYYNVFKIKRQPYVKCLLSLLVWDSVKKKQFVRNNKTQKYLPQVFALIL